MRKLEKYIRTCACIGNIPSSYIDAMSYEEQILWLCKFLDEKVLPVINQNSKDIEDLQKLDLQDEVNKKLEEMAEDGTLQEIMAEYLNTKAIFAFNNIQELKEATNLINGSFAETYGYSNPGDGGASKYKVRQVTNQDEEDDAFIIALNDTNLVAELIIEDNEIKLPQLGCNANTSYDSSIMIQKAINKDLKINGLNKRYNVLSSITVKDNTTITNCTFKGTSDLDFIKSNVNKDIHITNCVFVTFNKAIELSVYYSVFDNIHFDGCYNCLRFINGSAPGNLVDNMITNIKTYACGQLLFVESGNKLTDMTIKNIVHWGNDENQNAISIGACAGYKIDNVHTFGSCNTAMALGNIFKSNISNIYIESYKSNAMNCYCQTSCNMSNIIVNALPGKNVFQLENTGATYSPQGYALTNITVCDSGEAPAAIFKSGTNPATTVTNLKCNKSFKINDFYSKDALVIFDHATKINNSIMTIDNRRIRNIVKEAIQGAEKSVTIPFNFPAYSQNLFKLKFIYTTWLTGALGAVQTCDVLVNRNSDATNLRFMKSNNDFAANFQADIDNNTLTITFTPSSNSQYGILEIEY